MIKIVLTIINEVFLAFVLLAGTFATVSPSFMVGTAQTEPLWNREIL